MRFFIPQQEKVNFNLLNFSNLIMNAPISDLLKNFERNKEKLKEKQEVKLSKINKVSYKVTKINEKVSLMLKYYFHF